MIQAFGVNRFGLENGQQVQRPAPEMVADVNQRLTQLGLTGDNVITIFIDDGFYHVFYKQKTA
jgi:hypothetical protein